MPDTYDYLEYHLPRYPSPCPEHLSLHYSADAPFHPLSPQWLKVVPAFADNTAVGTTAACTDGNAAPAVAGSTPLAVTLLIFYTSNNNTMQFA